MKKRAVVYTVDADIGCLLQLTTSLNSLRKMSSGQNLDVFVLTNSPKPWMEGLYGAKIVDVSGLVGEYKLDSTGIEWRHHKVSPMLLFRLLIPLVPCLKDYEEILYLDTDTEVWNSQFFSIFDMFPEKEMVAVHDSLSEGGTVFRIIRLRQQMGNDWRSEEMFSRWDDLVSGSRKYVNSGVLVFRMDKLRKGYEDRIRHIINVMIRLKPGYPDQDMINIYFDLGIVDDRKYNGWLRAARGCHLRHYVGCERKKSKEYPPISEMRPNDALDGAGFSSGLGLFSGKVDKLYVLSNREHPEHMETMRKWLSDNGVTDYSIIDVSYSGKYDNILDDIPHDKIDPKHMDNWMGHYRSIVDGMENGLTKIGIFESDFNMTGIGHAIKRLRPDFDLAICTGGGEFSRTSIFSALNSKGYIIGPKGMMDLRRLFDSLFDKDTRDRRLRYVHKWLTDTIMNHSRTMKRN